MFSTSVNICRLLAHSSTHLSIFTSRNSNVIVLVNALFILRIHCLTKDIKDHLFPSNFLISFSFQCLQSIPIAQLYVLLYPLSLLLFYSYSTPLLSYWQDLLSLSPSPPPLLFAAAQVPNFGFITLLIKYESFLRWARFYIILSYTNQDAGRAKYTGSTEPFIFVNLPCWRFLALFSASRSFLSFSRPGLNNVYMSGRLSLRRHHCCRYRYRCRCLAVAVAVAWVMTSSSLRFHSRFRTYQVFCQPWSFITHHHSSSPMGNLPTISIISLYSLSVHTFWSSWMVIPLLRLHHHMQAHLHFFPLFTKIERGHRASLEIPFQAFSALRSSRQV